MPSELTDERWHRLMSAHQAINRERLEAAAEDHCRALAERPAWPYLVDQLFNSSEKRLARVLLLMANFGKEGETEPVIPASIGPSVLSDRLGEWHVENVRDVVRLYLDLSDFAR